MRLNLTRDQLATFLKTPEQIRQFEGLFTVADDVSNNTDTQGISIVASIANAKAKPSQNDDDSQVSALAQMSAIRAQVASIRGFCGSFYSTQTQTAATLNTATIATFDGISISQGVRLIANRFYVDGTGVFNFDTSIQLDKTSGGSGNLYLWFRKNGVNEPNSASQIRILGNNAEVFTSVNYFVQMKQGDYVELMYSMTDLSLQILAVPAAAPHPGIPSIIMTVNSVQS
jgi:hypothetical protein